MKEGKWIKNLGEERGRGKRMDEKGHGQIQSSIIKAYITKVKIPLVAVVKINSVTRL